MMGEYEDLISEGRLYLGQKNYYSLLTVVNALKIKGYSLPPDFESFYNAWYAIGVPVTGNSQIDSLIREGYMYMAQNNLHAMVSVIKALGQINYPIPQAFTSYIVENASRILSDFDRNKLIADLTNGYTNSDPTTINAVKDAGIIGADIVYASQDEYYRVILEEYRERIRISNIPLDEKNVEISRVNSMIEDLARSPTSRDYDWKSFNPSQYTVNTISKTPQTQQYYVITPEGSTMDDYGRVVPKKRSYSILPLTLDQVNELKGRGYDIISINDGSITMVLQGIERNNALADQLLNSVPEKIQLTENIGIGQIISIPDPVYWQDESKNANSWNNQTQTGQGSSIGLLLLAGVLLNA